MRLSSATMTMDRTNTNPRGHAMLDRILVFLSTATNPKTVHEVAVAVDCTLGNASKALSLLASIGLIVLDERGATLDPDARELLEEKID